MADEIKAKYVRMYAPGGASINFMGVTGNSHFSYPVPMTIIKKALDRGILVFEELAEAAKDGATEVQLTLENYVSDLSGKKVTADTVVVTDIEKEVEDAHAAEAEAATAAQGLEIKAKQEKIVEEYNKANGSTQVIEGSGQDPIVGPGENPSFPGINGGGDPVIDGGDNNDEGGSSGPQAGGETMTEEPGEF